MDAPGTIIQELRSAQILNEEQSKLLYDVCHNADLITPGKAAISWANIIGAPLPITGDVTGPSVSLTYEVPVFLGMTGKVLGRSGARILPSGTMDLPSGATYNIAGVPHTHPEHHSHANQSILQNLSETAEGKLVYRGYVVEDGLLDGGDAESPDNPFHTEMRPAGSNGDIQINDHGLWGSVTPLSGFNKSIGTSPGTIAAGDDARFHNHLNIDVVAALSDYGGKLAYNGVIVDQNAGATGTGNVIGPDNSVRFNVALFSDISGKRLMDGGSLGDAAFKDIGTASGTVAAGNDTRFHLHSNYSVIERFSEVNDMLYFDGYPVTSSNGAGTGNVTGPLTSVVGHVAVFDNITGSSLRDGGVLGNAASKNIGTVPGTVAAGDDSRFSEPRTPTVHGNDKHSKLYITKEDITFEVLELLGLIGINSDQLSKGNHTHNELPIDCIDGGTITLL